MIVAAVVMGIATFFMKDKLFDIVLAPKDSSFCTYRLLGIEDFSIQLVNTDLT
jgi:sec-independent protein translocase protein TatC